MPGSLLLKFRGSDVRKVSPLRVNDILRKFGLRINDYGGHFAGDLRQPAVHRVES